MDERSPGQRLLDILKPEQPEQKPEPERERDATRLELKPVGLGLQNAPSIQSPGMGFGNSRAGLTQSQREAREAAKQEKLDFADQILQQAKEKTAARDEEPQREPHTPDLNQVRPLEGPPSGHGRGGRRL